MKKKWQLIKEAYDRYPKGTECLSPLTGVLFTASGSYEVLPPKAIYCVESQYMIYSEVAGGKWATIVEAEQKPDLLEGKVAIRVNDEHEFKALMKHYEEKGWISIGKTKPKKVVYVNQPIWTITILLVVLMFLVMQRVKAMQ